MTFLMPRLPGPDEDRCGSADPTGHGCILVRDHGGAHMHQDRSADGRYQLSISWQDPPLCGVIGPGVTCWREEGHDGRHGAPMQGQTNEGPAVFDVSWEVVG